MKCGVELSDCPGVLPGHVEDESLQVGGLQDVDGGRRGVLQGMPAQVVGPFPDEARQNVVGVGGADEASYRNPHLLRRSRWYIW